METLREAWRAAWTRVDRRPIYEWGAQYVYLPPGEVYTISGFFNVQRSRHFIGPFDALHDDLVRVVSVRFPVRFGKSLIADIWLPWLACNDPGPFMWNLTTEGLAKSHFYTRTLPVLRACKPVARLLPERRLQTMRMFLRHGMPVSIQTPSIGNLTGVPVRFMVEDELWQRTHASHGEAKGRLGDAEKLGNSKLLCLAQAGVEDDPEDVEFTKGDQCEWEVQCPKCDRYFVPQSFGYRDDGSPFGLVWDRSARDGRGNFILPRVMETVRYENPCCGHGNSLAQELRAKAAWNRTGKYVPTNPDPMPGHKSFHAYAPIDRPWLELAAELAACQNALKLGLIDLLKSFKQKRDAQSWKTSLIHEATPERRVVYDVRSDWPEECGRIMTVDKQTEGVFWIIVRAWSAKGRSRLLCFKKCFGWAEVHKTEAEWKVEPQLVLVDSGFEAKGPDGVYAACAEHGWTALKGEEEGGRRSFTHVVKKGGRSFHIEKSYSVVTFGDPESGTAGEGRRYARLIRFASDTMNERLDRMRVTDKFERPRLANEDLEQAYIKQVAAEYKKITRDVDGTVRERWVCPSRNNHARDCEKMQLVGATIRKWIPDTLEEAAAAA